MAINTDAEVVIGGKVFTLSGAQSKEYLREVADYINGKLEEISSDGEYKKLPVDMRNVLLQINLADDYFNARKEAEKITYDARLREKDLYDIKHELVAVQMKLDMAERKIKQYEADAAAMSARIEELEKMLQTGENAEAAEA